MATSRSHASIVDEMDALFADLIAGAPADVRSLSFNLYLAALSVAVHGCDQVPKELANRAVKWRAGRQKRSEDEKNRAWTAHAVKGSPRPKNRVPADGQGSAFEIVAKSEGISPSAAEKRRYRKPKR
jgi:hypothetical protein